MRIPLIVLSLLLPALAAGQQPSVRRPNVVLIITDDVGYGDIGVYGAPDVRTPNIDALARQGVRLTEFYANGATCSPTRAGLITGRYQQRYAIEVPLGSRPNDHDVGLPVTGRSLPQLLKNAGYATALVGKWHLGWKPEFSPIRHGVTGRAQQAVRSGKWKLVMDGQRAMLFDLDGDVSERTNLIAGHTDLAKRLRTQLAAWQADVDAEAKQRAARTRLPDS